MKSTSSIKLSNYTFIEAERFFKVNGHLMREEKSFENIKEFKEWLRTLDNSDDVYAREVRPIINKSHN